MVYWVVLTCPATPSFPLPPRPTGHLTDAPLPTLLCPLCAHAGEVIGEDAGGAAAVGAVHDDDRLVGELHARVVIGNLRVVPFGDLAEVDVGHVFRGELQPLGDAGKVVGDDHCPHDGRDVDEFAGGRLQFLIGQELVACSEIDRLGRDLLDAAAAADGLVVELDRRVDLGVLAEPLGVERVREGGSGAVDEGFGRGLAGGNDSRCHGQNQHAVTYPAEHSNPP